jgi:exopolyphosphatase/guanosine-5'-triphosphate,3'-diphosphate pyrophosphatase
MKNIRIASIIYIGSTYIGIRVCQNRKNKLHMLEKAKFRLSLGKEVFENRRIPAEKVDIIVDTIKKYKKLSEEYGCEKIRLLATTALRESENRYYIRDRIFQETGVILEILSDAELKNHIFMSNIEELKIKGQLEENGMLAFIGSGNLGIAFYENSFISYLQNILIGTLKLYEIAKNAEKYSDKMNYLVKEQLHTYTNFLPKFLPKNEMKFLLVAGRATETIGMLCNVEDETGMIGKEEFHSFFKKITDMNAEKISAEYNVRNEFANEIIIATTIIENLVTISGVEGIILPDVFFFNTMFNEMLFPVRYMDMKRRMNGYTVSSSVKLAEMYKAYDNHIQFVDSVSEKIMKKLSRTNQFNDKEFLYLKIAVILHNIGKFINSDKHYINSSYIIRNTDIIGLTEKDRELISLIVKYQSFLLPSEEDEEYSILSPVEKICVSKLSAILRIADSLDKNYKQKFKEIIVKMQKGDLIIQVDSKKNTYIEQIKFNEYKDFFKEVYGMDIKLLIKRGM